MKLRLARKVFSTWLWVRGPHRSHRKGTVNRACRRLGRTLPKRVPGREITVQFRGWPPMKVKSIEYRDGDQFAGLARETPHG